MFGLIIVDPRGLQWQPIIAETRIGARTIFEILAAEDSVEDGLEENPTLTRSDAIWCFERASNLQGNQINTGWHTNEGDPRRTVFAGLAPMHRFGTVYFNQHE